jgi:hypothetical protein
MYWRQPSSVSGCRVADDVASIFPFAAIGTSFRWLFRFQGGKAGSIEFFGWTAPVPREPEIVEGNAHGR